MACSRSQLCVNPSLCHNIHDWNTVFCWLKSNSTLSVTQIPLDNVFSSLLFDVCTDHIYQRVGEYLTTLTSPNIWMYWMILWHHSWHWKPLISGCTILGKNTYHISITIKMIAIWSMISANMGNFLNRNKHFPQKKTFTILFWILHLATCCYFDNI